MEKASKVLKAHTVDLLITEVRFSKGNALKFVSKTKAEHPHCNTLIFTIFEEDQYALPFLYAGANGYIDKTKSQTEIQDAIAHIFGTGQFYSDSLKNMVIDDIVSGSNSKKLENLSEREMQIAKLLGEGRSNMDISKELNLHFSTISTYKRRLFEKLEVENTLDLFEFLKKYGMI